MIQVIPADIKVALDLDDYITGLGQKQSERDDEDEVRNLSSIWTIIIYTFDL